MFVLQEDGSLTAMKPSLFALEDEFQRLLEDHPELLAGELIDPDEPRRWLLVTREIGIPTETDGPGWWSADHLFLDQDGIPTIVEVKRQTDTRIRREVVGQMLDYAANAVVHLKIEVIRGKFEENCQLNKVEAAQELQHRLGQDIDVEKFWMQVKTNIEAQKIRLLFVADDIPRELKRVVEFLNRQMNPAEVLALELRQFLGDNGLRTIVPTLYGQTEETRGLKTAAPTRKWDEASFFDDLAIRQPEAVSVARKIADWMGQNADRITYGKGMIDGSINAVSFWSGQKLYPLTITTQGKLFVNFGYCKRGPFESDAMREEWMKKLTQIPGLSLSTNGIDKYPMVHLASMQGGNTLSDFLQVMSWFVDVLRESKPEPLMTAST
jgi:hypothetical protein